MSCDLSFLAIADKGRDKERGRAHKNLIEIFYRFLIDFSEKYYKNYRK